MYWVQPAFDRGIIGNTCTREKKGRKCMERIYKGGKVEGNGEDIRKERGKEMEKI